MSAQRKRSGAVTTIGFAVGSKGDGVAYATLVDGRRGRREVLRVPFAANLRAGLQERDATYAAVTAVAGELLARGELVASIVVADERLVDDLDERRALPHALTMPYVALRCRLNRLRDAAVVAAVDDDACRDLSARARADLFLDSAA